jgi:trehalose 6-phosphate phosphatase
MSPISTEIPSPLPGGLLARLAADHEIDLFLDYDGTISEITPDIANAKPLPGAAELIAGMAARPDRFRIVMISGRQADKLSRLLGVSASITFVGNHGLEMIEPDGRRHMVLDPTLFTPALDSVRTWMRVNAPPEAGFVIEDKGLSVALHYRLADPALAWTTGWRLREFVKLQVPPLVTGEGKMVIEVMPPDANKGAAVRTLISADSRRRLPVYFGDDTTDEDGFYALREHGVTVRVCEQPTPSWARYRVRSPQDVLAALAGMMAAVGSSRSCNN